MNARYTVSLLAVLVWLGGCATAPPAPAGRLVIVGGALSREHGEVFRRVLERVGADGTVGVLPTASGVPDESGPYWRDGFDAWAARPVAEIVPLTTANAERAEAPEIAAEIAACRGLFFTGGDQSRITAVFRPDSGDTPCYRAVRELLDRGGVISGSSAGAAMMSDPMIRGGSSIGALRSGARFGDQEPETGVWIGKGMGLFPYGIVDQHFLARGRLGRLVVALVATHTRFGFGIDEDNALVVDLGTGTIETVGPRALLLVDAGGANRDESGYTGLRIDLLGDGGIADATTGEVRPAAHERRLSPPAAEGTLDVAAKPFDRDALTGAIASLANGEAGTVRIGRADWFVELRRTPSTRFYSDGRTEPDTIHVVGLELAIRSARAP